MARRASDRGDATIRHACQSLLSDAFADVSQALRQASGVESEVLAHGVAALPDGLPALQRWFARSPSDPDLQLLLAIRRLDAIPWLATELEAERDEEQQWLDENESLWRAVEHLQRTLAAEPGRPVALVWLAAIAGALVWRGMMPRQDFDRCAADADAAAPGSVQVARWRVHVAELDGSDPVAAAEQAAHAWPEGDPRHAEVATAHIGRYRDILGDGKEAAQAYWLRDDVHQSLTAADGRFGAAGPSPAEEDAASIFAFTLSRTSEPRLALRHFDRVKGRVVSWPWAMLRNPVAAYDELEERARANRLTRLLRRW